MNINVRSIYSPTISTVRKHGNNYDLYVFVQRVSVKTLQHQHLTMCGHELDLESCSESLLNKDFAASFGKRKKEKATVKHIVKLTFQWPVKINVLLTWTNYETPMWKELWNVHVKKVVYYLYYFSKK